VSRLSTGKASAILLNQLVLPGSTLTAYLGSEVTENSLGLPISDVGDYRLEYLSDSDPDLQWRGPQDEHEVVFVAQFSRLSPLNAVALCHHNLESGSQFDVAYYAGGYGLQNKVAEYLNNQSHRSLYLPFELNPFAHKPFGYPIGHEGEILWPYSSLFVDEIISDMAVIRVRGLENAEGFFRSGYLAIGRAYSPAINIKEGWGVEYSDGQFSNTPSGLTIGDQSVRKRIANVSWSRLTLSEANRAANEMLIASKFDSLQFLSAMHGAGGASEDRAALLGFVTSQQSPRFVGSSGVSAMEQEITEVTSLI